MGARNVSACYAMWQELPHPAFRLLVGMALQSLDQTSAEGRPARVWFGGQEALVEMVGRTRRPAYAALAVLREAGAIEPVDNGRLGHRAVYKLALDPMAKGAESSTQQGAEKGSKGCGKQHLKGAESSTPRNHKGSLESRQGNKSPKATTSPDEGKPVDNFKDSSSVEDRAGCAQPSEVAA